MRARSWTAAERSAAVCAVGYQWRGVEALDALREALAGQQLGLLIGIGTGPTQSRPWFLDRAQGGGNLLERASHIIDLERAVGGEVVEVQAAASRVALAQSAAGDRGDIEDAAALVLRFAAAASARSRSRGPATSCPASYSLDVLGSDSSLHLELDPVVHAERPLGAARASRSPMRGHPMDRTLERFVEAAAARREVRGLLHPAPMPRERSRSRSPARRRSPAARRSRSPAW